MALLTFRQAPLSRKNGKFLHCLLEIKDLKQLSPQKLSNCGAEMRQNRKIFEISTILGQFLQFFSQFGEMGQPPHTPPAAMQIMQQDQEDKNNLLKTMNLFSFNFSYVSEVGNLCCTHETRVYYSQIRQKGNQITSKSPKCVFPLRTSKSLQPSGGVCVSKTSTPGSHSSLFGNFVADGIFSHSLAISWPRSRKNAQPQRSCQGAP